MDNILIYSEALSGIEYSPDHPFKPSRARQMLDLLNRYSLIYENNQAIVEPDVLTDEELLTFHSADYIEALKKCDAGEFDISLLDYGLGTSDNPVFKDLFYFSSITSGGTLKGARLLLENKARFVFNPIGGYHHAMRNHASGFCYINDLVIAIMEMVRNGKKVAYIDIDAHHGDGVQEAFYGDSSVLSISIHESGHSLFPGTGFEAEIGRGEGKGYTVNIPLLKHSDDEVFIYSFEQVVPPLLKEFEPDIVCIQIGGDAHRDDPLANLNITSNGYERVLKLIDDLSPRVLATGGGGYNLFKTSAMWSLAWALFCGIEPHDDYAGLVGGMMYGPEQAAGSLTDEPFAMKGYEKDQCMNHAKDVVKYLQKFAIPLLSV